ncbi:hypothetical protein SARC_15814, partial [Sphaeroforma arctica JP610]
QTTEHCCISYIELQSRRGWKPFSADDEPSSESYTDAIYAQWEHRMMRQALYMEEALRYLSLYSKGVQTQHLGLPDAIQPQSDELLDPLIAQTRDLVVKTATLVNCMQILFARRSNDNEDDGHD